MSAAKKQDSSSHWPRKLFAWLLGPGRPVLVFMVLAGLFGGGWLLAWRKLKPRILGGPEYRVGPEQVEITPLPPWIHTDVRAEAFHDPALAGPLSLMDDDLVDRIRKAFSERPWVRTVNRVTKCYPASAEAGLVSVKVDLVYRQPVCMVEVPDGVLPVDAYGVLLPSTENFTPLEAKRYPRLVRMDRLPTVPVGGKWSDSRVIGGAEIAAALGAVWDSLGLDRIEPLPDDQAAGTTAGATEPVGGDSRRRLMGPVFALFTRSDGTRGGSRIVWGYAPGANVLGEIPADEKVARLVQYHSKYDTLDSPQGKAQQLDVRTLDKATLPPAGP
jgi:hypothetical protein